MMLAAVALMLTQKADGPDFAPLILMLAAAETAGMAGFWNSVVVTASSVGILVVADVEGTLIGAPVYLVGIVVGVWVGIALHWQQRAISAERARREAAQEQAVQAERQRIAREVHDVVGHSLSVTLLHLTGARLALEQDGDIEEAVHALTDAERIGRAAMTDLRRSVGLLAADKSAIEPLPNIDDLAVLVDDVRNAGIDIRLVQSGDLSRVGASSGLGLYRIAQESLANIVKHAPTSHGSVVLAAANGHVRLTIRNTVAEPPAAETDGGTGLPGMAARAEQLGATLKAGPDGNEWVVDVLVPLAVTV
jgi:signal transduction histidine kinase